MEQDKIHHVLSGGHMIEVLYGGACLDQKQQMQQRKESEK